MISKKNKEWENIGKEFNSRHGVHKRRLTQFQELYFRMELNILFVASAMDICLNIQWNLSNPTHKGTRKMCLIVQDV